MQTKNALKKVLINGGVLFVSLLVILVLLEIGVRVFTEPVYPILRTDRWVGSIHERDFNGRIWNAESKSWNYIITNSLGYIGEEPTAEGEAERIRIAFLGDSMIEGLQVDYYNNFVEKLETALNISNTDKTFELLNFGVGGSSTFLEYQTYKHKVRSLNPNAVILVFDDNDFNDNLSKMNFDLERYDQGEQRNIWLKDFLLRFELPKFAFTKLQHNLFFLKALDKIGLYELNDILEQRKAGLINIEEVPEYYSYTFEILRKLRDACLADGISFSVVFMPHEKDYNELGACDNNKDWAKLSEFLEGENVPYFNPCLELYEARQQYDEDECFNYNCSAAHMTKLGHEEFAKILFRHIKF